MSDYTEARVDAREQQAKGMWKQFSGRIQEAWGALTNDDLDRFEGKRDQLIGRIQEETGEARADVARKLDQFADELKYRFD